MPDRIIHPTSPDDAARIDAIAAAVEAERPELIARYRRRRAAESEAGLRGDLRRAITASMIGPDKLADVAGVDVSLLMDFQEGVADLPFLSIEKLLNRLGMELALVHGSSGGR